jgi:hypothetical protein
MPIYCTSHVVEKWYKKFCKILVWDLIVQSHEAKHSQCRPFKGNQTLYRVFSLNKKTRSTPFYCTKCDDGLCVVDCFEKWHMRVSRVWAQNGVGTNCEVTQFIYAYSMNKICCIQCDYFLQNQNVSSFEKKLQVLWNFIIESECTTITKQRLL